MTKRRVNISIILMLLAIVAIVSFQSYWLRKNFVEEEENLGFRTNVLFRDAMQMVQADRLELDTSVNFKVRSPYNVAGTLDVMRRRVISDSMHRKKMATTEILIEKGKMKFHADAPPRRKGDTSAFSLFRGGPGYNGQVIQILRGVESLHDSITVQELSKKYAQLMKEEKIDLGFNITKRKAPERADDFFPMPDEPRNEITLGFSKPVTFRLDLQDTTWYTIKK